MSRKGFTLIELLIVVAIIAILAAIAVPNFLEAQIRARVSRAKNDLRSLGVAAEVYRVDNTAWPLMPIYDPAGQNAIANARRWPWQYGVWFPLTTPIAYLSSIPHDTFKREFNEQWGIWQDYYRGWNLEGLATRSVSNTWGAPSTIILSRMGVTVFMCSVGPDQVEDLSDGTAGRGLPGAGGVHIYDATNGTISWGDIYYACGWGLNVPEPR